MLVTPYRGSKADAPRIRPPVEPIADRTAIRFSAAFFRRLLFVQGTFVLQQDVCIAMALNTAVSLLSDMLRDDYSGQKTIDYIPRRLQLST